MPPVGIGVFAPAKINLTLHVTGRRADGYHLLDSLVVFADVGDDLFVQIGNTISVTTEGPEAAAVPADMDNLVLRVARLFDGQPGASFLLTKNLPVASGIGGGSADAAAAFRALMTHWSGGEVSPAMFDPATTPMIDRLVALGADIPVCLTSGAARIRGIGEQIEPVAGFPPLDAVLVNPRRPVATPAVFGALARCDNPPMSARLPRFAGVHHVADWLAQQRNDLEPAAIALEPAIAQVKSELESFDTCLMARMSGSGATCFGLFADRAAARSAAEGLRSARPDWWIAPATLGSMTDAVQPQLS